MNQPLAERRFLKEAPKTIGTRLRHAREARGLTQGEAAKSLGVARTTLSAIETGNRQVRPDELLHLSGVYGRTLNELIGEREIVSDFASQLLVSRLAKSVSEAKAELSEAVHRFQRLCEDYLFLETTIGVSLRRDYPPEYPIMQSRPEQSGQDAATAERNRLGLGDGPIPDLRRVLEDEVGLRVFTIPIQGGRPLRLQRGSGGMHCRQRIAPARTPSVDPGSRVRPLSHRQAQGGHRTPDDAPEYRPTLRETGLDRQLCAVHMQRTVGRHLRRIDDDPAHLDRALLPILPRLAWEWPPEAGPVLLGLWESVAQGRVRLREPVRNLLFHLVENRSDLVRSERDPDVPASTNRIEGWFGRSGPGPAWRGG